MSVLLAVVPARAVTGATKLVSGSPHVSNGNGRSQYAAISDNGRYVAFLSFADNFFGGGTPGGKGSDPNAFVRDLETGDLWQVDVDSSGNPSDGGIDLPGSSGEGPVRSLSISEDGSVVAFTSDAGNLGGTRGRKNVYVHYMPFHGNAALADKTVLVSVRRPLPGDLTDVEGNGDSYEPSISRDGRFVAFTSDASDLVPFDSNEKSDVFVRELEKKETVRRSVSGGGVEGGSPAHSPSISESGRYIAFATASQLDSGDGNGVEDIYLYDTAPGSGEATLQLISLAPTKLAGNGRSYEPVVSATKVGKPFVAFTSVANNLACPIPSQVPSAGTLCAQYQVDPNATPDVYLRDVARSVTSLVSVAAVGLFAGRSPGGQNVQPAISSDGLAVAFTASTDDFVSDPARQPPQPGNGHDDVFVRDLAGQYTELVSTDSFGNWFPFGAQSSGASIAGAGGRIVFDTNWGIVIADGNGVRDVYLRDRTVCEAGNRKENGTVSGEIHEGEPTPVGHVRGETGPAAQQIHDINCNYVAANGL